MISVPRNETDKVDWGGKMTLVEIRALEKRKKSAKKVKAKTRSNQIRWSLMSLHISGRSDPLVMQREYLVKSNVSFCKQHEENGCLSLEDAIFLKKAMESRQYVQNLSESIHSLLGLKTHLTSTWDNSVCNIIKDLSSEETCNCSQIKCLNLKKMCSSENKESEVASVISKIQGDLATLTAQLNQLNIERKQTLYDFLDLKGNIRVFCRIRPIIPVEKSGHLRSVVDSDSSNVILKLAENKIKQYSFDKVFDSDSTQDDVFLEIEPVIKSAVDGYNACIFAYGQTGTGKTFTMEGKPDCPGVVPRAIEELFKQAEDSNHQFLFTFSMLEIYMGNLRDLLIPRVTKAKYPMTECLPIQADPKGGIEIDNLVEIRVSDFNQAKKLYALGSRFRSTASTNSNLTSSRSHCLIRITLTASDAMERRRETNKIWMVDLGGSERMLKTKAWGVRFEEGKAINLSLSALGDVISALQRRRPHVPFRNSKLTQVLRDSLGEDSKTLMLVHVSPKEEDLCETICSLGFATRVRSIQLGQEESKDVRDKREVAMAKLLQKVKQLEYDRQNMKRDIKRLNEGLEHLSRAVSSSDEDLEAMYKVPEGYIKMEKQATTYVTVASSTQLPTFMRPTICSRRKSCTDHLVSQNLQKKNSFPARRRKALSIRAESLSFPIKGNSEYGSTCSIARTSCLEDYGTEYSHNALECEVKTVVVFPEEEKPHSSLSSSKARVSQKASKGNGNRKANRLDFPKCSTVVNWLDLQKNEPTTSTHTSGSKRVFAVPLPQKKTKCNGQNNKANVLDHEEIVNHDLTKENLFNDNKIDKFADIEVIGNSIAEVVIGEKHTYLHSFAIGDSGFNAISPDYKVKIREKIWGVNRSIPPADMFDGFIQNEDHPRISERFIGHELPDEIPCFLENFMVKDSGCKQLSLSDVGNNTVDMSDRNNIIDLSEESHENALKHKMETESLNEGIVTTEGKLDINLNVQTEALTSECHRSLLMDQEDVDQNDPTMPSDESQEVSNTGTVYFFGQKVQMICASIFLGLGIRNLGLGHDFFHGLMR